MKKNYCLLVLLTLTTLLVFAFPCYAQITFIRNFGGSRFEIGNSVQQTQDGGYIVVGTANDSFNVGNIYLLKTNAYGESLWAKTYGDSLEDIGNSVRQTADGGYIIVGSTKNYGAVSSDIYLIKTDANGDTIWTRRFHGSAGDMGRCVRQTADGGYIITGYTNKTGSYPDPQDIYLIKTNANGNMVWYNIFGGTRTEDGYDVKQTADRGYIIAGLVWTYSYPYFTDVYVIKTDSLGNQQWVKNYGSQWNYEMGYSVDLTLDNGYIIAGGGSYLGAGGYTQYLIKTNANGDTLWTKIGSSSGNVHSVRTIPTGYMVAGYSGSASATDIALIKTDTVGNFVWTRSFGVGGGEDYAKQVELTSDGGYIIVGFTNTYGPNNIVLIKTDANGNAGIEQETHKPLYADRLSLEIFPNPAKSFFTVRSALNAPGFTLRMYDVTGKLIKVQEFKGSKEHRISLDGIKNGVYFVKVNDEIAKEKLVITK